MRLLQGFAVATLLAATVVAPMPAAAQVTLDTPDVVVTDNSATYVAFMVTAGASGAPYGFTIEWMPKSNFDITGWPADGYTVPGFVDCTFLDPPSFRLTAGLADFRLASHTGASIYLGELFDETGVSSSVPYTTYLDELAPETQYVVRVRAEGGPGYAASPNSASLGCGSGTHEVCRFTLGYWKNHSSAWPVSSLKLGNVTYTKAQLLLILGQPSLGNGLSILAHQLIAAKLNVYLSAPPAGIASAIVAADAMIGNLICRPITGWGSLSSASTNSLSIQLDDFNNGKTSGDSCLPTSATASTWGRLKTLYR